MRKLLWMAPALLLGGCGNNNVGGDSPVQAPVERADAVAPVAATGAGCAGIFGDPPRPPTQSVDGTLAQVYLEAANLCTARGGEVLTWTDAASNARQACLHTPAAASTAHPLPLVTFLHGSLFPGDPQTATPVSNLEDQVDTADLTGDPARAGFSLLVIEGRDTQHFYPMPDDTGWGWDNWYRNFDRNDPQLNLDAAAIDHFIAAVRARGTVDAKRLYLSGWSNGAAMAILYGLNTPGIAATSVYSPPEPFSDVDDPCAQPPFGDNLRPIMTVHNSCDIIGICITGGEGFRDKVAKVMPGLTLRTAIIDVQQNEVQACDASCAYDASSPASAATPGALLHLRWPTNWTVTMLNFLRDHPLD
jgi:predicted esterase